jgi:hypothetical protein
MKNKQQVFSNIFLFNTILFIGFSFEFFIRNDFFFGAVVIFTGVLNLIAFQTISRRVTLINIYLNLFNIILSYFIADNYGLINYDTLYIIWTVLTLYFCLVLFIQIKSRIKSIQKRKRIRKKFE